MYVCSGHDIIAHETSSQRIRQHESCQICNLFDAIGVRRESLGNQPIQQFQHRLIGRVILGPVQVHAFWDVGIDVCNETDEICSHVRETVHTPPIGRMELATLKKVKPTKGLRWLIPDLQNRGKEWLSSVYSLPKKNFNTRECIQPSVRQRTVSPDILLPKPIL